MKVLYIMKAYRWETEGSLVDRLEIMNDYLENINMMDVLKQDGGTVVARNCKGEIYMIYASSDGDTENHKVEFQLVKGDLNDYI